jgi:hypothetical protein
MAERIVAEDTRSWVAERTTLTGWLQVGFILAGVLLHAWAMAGGFFHMDDFFYLADASSPFGEYVTQVYNGHLMPGEFALVWISQAIAPMSWPLAVTISTLLWAVLGLGVMAVMRRAFGDHPITFVSLALVMFGPLLTTVSVWYASALQVLPWGAAFVWLLYFAIRDAQAPAHRWWIAGTLVYVIGLAFWEKVLLALPVVLWVAWRMWPGRAPIGLGGMGRRWILPAVTIAISAAYSLLYLAVQPEAPLRSDPSGSDIWEATRIGIGEVLLPGLFGAPWGGFAEGLVPASGRPWWVIAIVWQVVAITVIASVVRWRSAWNIWAILIAYSAVTIALFSFGRINAFGLILVYDPRYVEDLVIVTSVLLPFAFVRPRGSTLPSPRTFDLIGDSTARWMWPVAGFVLANLLFLSSLTVGWTWQDSAAREFVGNARTAMSAQPGLVVLDRKVPPNVMAELFLERANASYVLAGARLDVKWNGAGEELWALADDGSVYQPRIAVAATSFPGPDGDCGWRAFDAPISIGLDSALFAWTWIGRMEYLAAGDGTATINLDGEPIEIPVSEGLNEVRFVIVGEGDQLELMPPARVGMCVAKVELGQPEGPA